MKMETIIISAIIGLVLGIGGTVGVQHLAKKPDDPVIIAVGGDEVAKGQTEVQKKLIDLDLLVEPCSKSFIESKDNLLCREMFCRMQQRGIDASTSQQDCSEISNIANTKEIQSSCELFKADERTECVDLFFKRK